MTNVNVDVEKLQDFQSHLLKFNRTLSEEYGSMVSHWRSMQDYWNDPMYHKFGEALQEVARGIEAYLAKTTEHEAFLFGRIKAAIEYGNA